MAARKTLLDQTHRNRILQRVDALTAASARHWGRMNVHQMICHLSDGYRTAFGERTVPFYGTFLRRTIFKFFVLHTSLPIPKGKVKTIPESDQEAGGTRPVEFSGDVAELKRLVQLFGTGKTKLEGQIHPLFGRLSPAEWGVWGYRHADHHLRQFGA